LAKIAVMEKTPKTLQTDLDKKVTETHIIDGFDGLMARINALINYHGCLRFIMLLFLAIETSPIIAKLLSQREYDYKLEDLKPR
jgi:hypothetical protein